ncbi:branched-chain amino acid ABC transporter permease [Bradyrhizobium sp. U87765 SZCCT0131]|uniref:branched-chain amino acid ABC transporter permease n=1 Tax=unclassified Bradyrhizobium TaxID=2631580 RepID=UPI001BA840DA|nr:MULTISPECIES: branched-chain amino acid ABC transporter permease [unclassified Bradyrhizobium]MBR1220570.1 branched-chain amino acid ABC transporter permease [Bradyrhizobium sp. U87765 SZCCT0131]MBR1262976.1 branched-chain amino acid ABC transporter permease [Bradyrhizobium sp. U87765 SZCCT0134]MBR1307142.1 branched-chain amino acid ABC transporter permease [Bradyrhizobium sp. U87765 SZCCT0110]MBR1322971.1 branched-chain amino acid ABC transporter permease [Bradyrhizobium sp. U87765 SZCCT010
MRVLGLIAAAIALVVLPFVATGYVIYLANLLLTFTVLCLGMHIVIGEAGQFSLAQAAFYGIGIYTSGLAGQIFGWPFPLSILASGLVAGLVGLCIGTIALRMRDIYLALATFAFGEAMQWVFLSWTPVTGGPNGLRIPPATLFGFEIVSDKQAYPVVLAIAVLMIGVTIVISRSRLGRAFRAVRESEIAALAMGVPVKAMKLAAFALSAFFAGVAGAMFALYSTYIHPDSLGFQTTILVLTMVVVGGLGSLGGAVGGAIVFGLMSELLRQAPSYQEIIYGLILIVFMMFAPRGLFAFVGDSFKRFARA